MLSNDERGNFRWPIHNRSSLFTVAGIRCCASCAHYIMFCVESKFAILKNTILFEFCLILFVNNANTKIYSRLLRHCSFFFCSAFLLALIHPVWSTMRRLFVLWLCCVVHLISMTRQQFESVSFYVPFNGWLVGVKERFNWKRLSELMVPFFHSSRNKVRLDNKPFSHCCEKKKKWFRVDLNDS